MRKTLTITEIISEKHGYSGSREWTLRNVKDSEGKRYSTFQDIPEPGTYDCQIMTEPSQKMNPKTGQPYQNLKITAVYMPNQNPAPKAVRTQQNLNQFDRLEEKIDEIHQMLVDLTTNLAEKAEPTDKTPF